MVQATLKAQVEYVGADIEFEFGRTQATMEISARGNAAKKLKLKKGDKVEITIKKV